MRKQQLIAEAWLELINNFIIVRLDSVRKSCQTVSIEFMHDDNGFGVKNVNKNCNQSVFVFYILNLVEVGSTGVFTVNLFD